MENKSVGVELITKERQKQIDKHGFTAEHHVRNPQFYDISHSDANIKQLQYAALTLIGIDIKGTKAELTDTPINWDKDWFQNLLGRPQKERLVIAGALIAAELDRLDQLEKQ